MYLHIYDEIGVLLTSCDSIAQNNSIVTVTKNI